MISTKEKTNKLIQMLEEEKSTGMENNCKIDIPYTFLNIHSYLDGNNILVTPS